MTSKTASAPSHLFNTNALRLLCKRYLLPGDKSPQCAACGVRHETIDEFLDRVSLGMQKYRSIMAELLFLPNSPTLFNVRTGMGTLSACFKFDVPDSMEGIMDVAKKAALVQKWGGGVGYYVGEIREKDAPIATTHKKACGPLSVLQHFNSVASLVTQGGKREGAQMGILPCDHPNVKDFIQMKNKDPQGLATFNISVAITDDFMRDAHSNKGGSEDQLLWEMALSAWNTGDPGVYFTDKAERGNPTPWLGRLTGTNPCGEVPLLDNEACNLGSLNLGKFVRGKEFDYDRLLEVTEIATEYLDDIVTENTFPHPDITEAVAATRKLGLGVMGWADALALMGIDYDSNHAFELGEEVMERINHQAHITSEAMGETKGPYPGWMAQDWERGADIYPDHKPDNPEELYAKRRNATLTCIAPTGSISILAGCSSGIEPHFALEWERTMGDGEKMQESIPVMDQLNGFKPKVSHDIGWLAHVKTQVVFQRNCDLASSKTINMPNSATKEEIYDAYFSSWQNGAKGITIYRDGCRDEQVLVAGPQSLSQVSTSGNGREASVVRTNGRVRLPAERKAVVHRFQVGEQEGYLTVGLYENGMPGEVFVTMSKEGSTTRGLMDAFATSISIALQNGVPLDYLVKKFSGSRFEPSGMTQNSDIPFSSSLIDYMFRWLGLKFTHDDVLVPVSIKHGDACPECGSMLNHAAGCEECESCGYNRCG